MKYVSISFVIVLVIVILYPLIYVLSRVYGADQDNITVLVLVILTVRSLTPSNKPIMR